MSGHHGAADSSAFGPRTQLHIVSLPYPAPMCLNRLPLLQLCVEESREDITHQIAGADVHPCVFVHLSAKEPAAIGSFLADDFRPPDQSGIVDQQRAALATTDVLRFVKTLCSQSSE